jgi:hypothetical protein
LVIIDDGWQLTMCNEVVTRSQKTFKMLEKKVQFLEQSEKETRQGGSRYRMPLSMSSSFSSPLACSCAVPSAPPMNFPSTKTRGTVRPPYAAKERGPRQRMQLGIKNRAFPTSVKAQLSSP